MKKLILMTLIVFILFLSSYAQIRVDANGFVGVGTPNMLARFNIQPQLSEPSASNLLIGNYYTATEGSMSLGVHNNYAWIQTWNNKPLYINRAGNNVIFCNQYIWGDVGIGQNITPSAKLDVNGMIHASGSITSSDSRLKINMNKITLDNDFKSKFRKIEPLTYEWKNDQFKGMEKDMDKLSKIDRDFYNRLQYGFSAQDVLDIFPELVYENNTGILGINYQGFIPILFVMVQDQQAKIEELNSAIQTLKNDCYLNSNLKSASILTAGNENLTSENVLFQNSPNPFTATTNIKYYLTNTTNSAILNIYNLNGEQVKSIELRQKGEGNITINSGEFRPGMYLYTLITDGEVIDTKRMILTD